LHINGLKQNAKARGAKMKQKKIVDVKSKVDADSSIGNLPEKKFRAGAISATVWLNKGTKTTGEEATFRTISLDRSYTDAEGNWHNSRTFRIHDLPKVQLLMQEAYKHLVFAQQDLFKGV
jgi:hypothetical protein